MVTFRVLSSIVKGYEVLIQVWNGVFEMIIEQPLKGCGGLLGGHSKELSLKLET